MRRAPNQRSTKRTHSVVITLNDLEYQALIKHCERKRTTSRAALLREIIMAEVIRTWERESPMLFSDEEMR